MTPQFNPLKIVVTLVFTAYGIWCALHPGTFRFIDGVNLFFHELGHWAFAEFGRFLTVLGGTLGQLLVPLAFFIYFLKTAQRFSAFVVFWWVAENFFNIATYMRDAEDMALPLVSPGAGEDDEVTHDWNWLLSNMNLLDSHQSIANLTHGLGVLLLAVSVAGMFYYGCRRQLPDSIED